MADGDVKLVISGALLTVNVVLLLEVIAPLDSVTSTLNVPASLNEIGLMVKVVAVAPDILVPFFFHW